MEESLKCCEEEKARLKQENQELRQENQHLKQQVAVEGLVLGAQGNAMGQMAQSLVIQQSLLGHGVQLNDLREENQKLRKENQKLKGLRLQCIFLFLI